MNTLKKINSESTELPDCIISHIFSLLSLKNLVKTSALSKQWYHEWGLRKDLTFDLHNMFDYSTVPELPTTLPPFQQIQFQFAASLYNFMQTYPGDMISSIRVKFPLGIDHTYAIDGLIHKGVLKGANRIELLFACETDFNIQPYKFLFPFLSGPNSLTYLHLQNCHLAATMEFSGLKNLRTLVLTIVPVKQNMLHYLFFNCIHLENFSLNQCLFLSDLKITSPSLLHLNINCGPIISWRNIDIIASKLLSIEFSSDCNYDRSLRMVNIKSHMLFKFSYKCGNISNLVDFSGLRNVTTIEFDGLRECLQSEVITHLFSECLQLQDVTFKECKIKCDMKISGSRMENVYNFGTIARLHLLEDLTMHLGLSQISELRKDLVRFQNLRQLKLFIVGAYKPERDYLWILDIAMASPHLQKLSLTIINGNSKTSHMVGSQRQREHVRFIHKELKYVELHGCVCSITVIELASHLLRSATLLKQITFSSRHNFYIGAGRWTLDFDGCCWFERNFIHEHLKDEVNEQCRLIIL
ncbi:uncharacterized protein LOC127126097 isoform X2 [Lathyrus oleraceus]|uniref:F-box protein n=1 Tax=Pisum sativum TaxID=3888 RepID=A0A9D4XT37_PEA|nr:uncharacterized protein LOC127126097 isoform X2 [Pisum sativum]KAI5426584.1 hypothetical protein KIW84_032137 [Pisum sativum]